ncbi:MAG: fumarate hydratase, partial [Archaeoglobaceae archaeon]
MNYEEVMNAVMEIIVKAQTELPPDVVSALKRAYESEESEIAKRNLEVILENIEIAKKSKLPICQDTGIPFFFVEIGRELSLDFDIKKAIANA